MGFFTLYLRQLYRLGDRLNARGRDDARERYRGIYRVTVLPTDERICWCLKEIKVGDYGWEARPWRKNGLIYLQGLSKDWGLVWIGGFRPDQIEYVGPKPVSQYDWRDFEYDGPKPGACYQWYRIKPKQACPFPVLTSDHRDRLQFPV